MTSIRRKIKINVHCKRKKKKSIFLSLLFIALAMCFFHSFQLLLLTGFFLYCTILTIFLSLFLKGENFSYIISSMIGKYASGTLL